MSMTKRELIEELIRLTKLQRKSLDNNNVEGFIAFTIHQSDTAALHIALNDLVGSLIGGGCIRHDGNMFWRQSFALVDVEHVVVTQEWNLLLFAGLFVLLFGDLPENNHAGLFVLLHLAAFLLALLERDILTRPT